MKELRLKFYADPAHGWLAVKRKILLQSGVEGRISPYSYMKGGTVYLEEDRDADLFRCAMLRQGYTIKTITKHTDKRSPIRSYESYRVLYFV